MKKQMIFLVLIACATWGCSASKVTGSAGDGKVPTADPKAAVIDAARKFTALNSVSGKVEATGETSFTKSVQYAGPDRYHTKYHDDAGADMEMIIVGQEAFIKSDDLWKKLHGDESPVPTMRNQFSDEVMKSISDAKFEGEDIIDGKPALVYTYKRVTLVGNFNVACKVWVGKTSGIPIKSYEDYSGGLVKTRTTTFDTDSPVTIDVPAK